MAESEARETIAIMTCMNIEISVADDGDGFPIISIDTGGNYLGPTDELAVDVFINGVQIHKMFAIAKAEGRGK